MATLRSAAPVAQLDRALASEAKGRRFDSCRAHHLELVAPPSFAGEGVRGPLAQLVEQLTLNQRVGGSSPPRPTSCDGHFQNIGSARLHFCHPHRPRHRRLFCSSAALSACASFPGASRRIPGGVLGKVETTSVESVGHDIVDRRQVVGAIESRHHRSTPCDVGGG